MILGDADEQSGQDAEPNPLQPRARNQMNRRSFLAFAAGTPIPRALAARESNSRVGSGTACDLASFEFAEATIAELQDNEEVRRQYLTL